MIGEFNSPYHMTNPFVFINKWYGHKLCINPMYIN
jgi:hypothetical protein